MTTKKIHSLKVKIPSLVQKISNKSSAFSKIHDKTKNKNERKTKNKSVGPSASGHVYILGPEDRSLISGLINSEAPQWHQAILREQIAREVLHFAGLNGPVWVYCKKTQTHPVSHKGMLEESIYSWHRDQVGSILSYAKAYHVKTLNINFYSTSEDQELGVFTGLELSSYSFKNLIEGKSYEELPEIIVGKKKGTLSKNILEQAQNLGVSINLARHLVNAPPNELNPVTLAEFVREYFSGRKDIKVDVWNELRLKKENMGLHLAVGQGSQTPPRMVHIAYRPRKDCGHKPIAIVGKGVTFDSGGLDIKPSSNMRLMKKDMGGVAALVGFAEWLSNSDCERPVDLYLGLAENSVDSKSMRPSDVYVARNGMKVEVHNTDAEGRMVLADVLDVAVTKKDEDEPELIIDVATLTGAIKAGLGADIIGLFANEDRLADWLHKAGQAAGEPNWRMPLYSRYTKGMDTPFADIVNCIDGFGGAITAALFLEKFVRNKPWAHLDIYAWNDKPTGALSFAGGSGQAVQTLVKFISALT